MRHGIASVNGEVQYGVLNLAGVGARGPQSAVQDGGERDPLSERPFQQLCESKHQIVELECRRRQVVPTCKRQQAGGQPRAHLRCVGRAMQKGLLVVGRKLRLEELQIAQDDCQQIVEVVGDPSGQLAECLHALRLDERGLRLLAPANLLLELLSALGNAHLQLRLALRQQILCSLALGHVAEQHHVDALVPDAELGDGRLRRKLRAILAQRKNFLALPHAARSHARFGESPHVTAVRRMEARWDEHVESLPQSLLLAVAEDGDRPVIELGNAQAPVECNDSVRRDRLDGSDLRFTPAQLFCPFGRGWPARCAFGGGMPWFVAHRPRKGPATTVDWRNTAPDCLAIISTTSYLRVHPDAPSFQ